MSVSVGGWTNVEVRINKIPATSLSLMSSIKILRISINNYRVKRRYENCNCNCNCNCNAYVDADSRKERKIKRIKM